MLSIREMGMDAQFTFVLLFITSSPPEPRSQKDQTL